MADDGFHEIQLSAKQLIFLCMAAALVLVVAFLSGVLVGRGVASQRDAAIGSAETVGAAPGTPDGTPADPGSQTLAAPPVTAIAPPTPAEEDLSYNRLLEEAQPPTEILPAGGTPPKPQPPAASPAARRPAAAPVEAPKPAAPAAAPATPAGADAALFTEPAGPGFQIKVAAFRERSVAARTARRLNGKGYHAYVVTTPGRGTSLYSVRVGKYPTRREADAARLRLEKEERFKPLVSR